MFIATQGDSSQMPCPFLPVEGVCNKLTWSSSVINCLKLQGNALPVQNCFLWNSQNQRCLESQSETCHYWKSETKKK